jgi:hypothetical protein
MHTSVIVWPPHVLCKLQLPGLESSSAPHLHTGSHLAGVRSICKVCTTGYVVAWPDSGQRPPGLEHNLWGSAQVLTTFGRPHWGDILEDVAHSNPGAVVGVFVCGLPAVCRGIQRAVQTFNATASRRIKARQQTSRSPGLTCR